MPTPIRPSIAFNAVRQGAVYGGPLGVPQGARSRWSVALGGEVEDYESYTNGQSITNATGFFDAGGTGGTSSVTATTADFARGSLSLLVAASAAESSNRIMSCPPETRPGYYGTWFKYDSDPGNGPSVVNLRLGGVAALSLIKVSGANTLRLRNATSAIDIQDTTITFSSGNWFFLSLIVDPIATTATLKIYNSAGTLVETLGGGAASYTAATLPDQFNIGAITAPTNATNFRYDDTGWQLTAEFVPTQTVVSISASETLSLSDTFSALSAALSATETLTGTDTTSTRSATLSAVDVLGLTDAFSALTAAFSATETLTLTDVVDTLNTGGGGPVPISASETLTFTDAVAAMTVTLSATETLALTDAVGARSATLSAAETLALTDAAGQTALSAAETLSLVDATLRVNLSATEALSFTDARGNTALSASETLAFAENYTDRTLSDTEFLLFNDAVGALVKTGGSGPTLLLLPYRRRPRRNTYGVANTRIAP